MPDFIHTAALVGSSIVQTFGLRVGAEQPRYVVLVTSGAVEVRRYEPRIAAETTVAGDPLAARNEGFRRIAGYIFGGNQKRTGIAMTSPVAQGASQEIAMTSPVAQEMSATGWKVQFFMPSTYALQDLPTPNDPSVNLVSLPPQTFAVLRFSGSRDPRAVERRQAQLIAHVSANGWTQLGKPVAWFYDPPWTLPFARRNEVAIEVASSSQGPARH
jgi:hypothetical protein